MEQAKQAAQAEQSGAAAKYAGLRQDLQRQLVDAQRGLRQAETAVDLELAGRRIELGQVRRDLAVLANELVAYRRITFRGYLGRVVGLS